METSSVGEKVLNAIVDILTIEELEEILNRKRTEVDLNCQPFDYEREKLKTYYRELLIKSGWLYPPKKNNGQST